jgi:hypothetical protein
MASTSTPPRSPVQRSLPGNTIADERGDYKPVPVTEDAVEARKLVSLDVVSSPSRSQIFMAVCCH